MSSGPLAKSAHMRMKMKKRVESHSHERNYLSQADEYHSPLVDSHFDGISEYRDANPAAGHSPIGRNDNSAPVSSSRRREGHDVSRRGQYRGINSLNTSARHDVVDVNDGSMNVPPSRSDRQRTNKGARSSYTSPRSPRHTAYETHEKEQLQQSSYTQPHEHLYHPQAQDETYQYEKYQHEYHHEPSIDLHTDQINLPKEGMHTHHLSPRQRNRAMKPRRDHDSFRENASLESHYPIDTKILSGPELSNHMNEVKLNRGGSENVDHLNEFTPKNGAKKQIIEKRRVELSRRKHHPEKSHNYRNEPSSLPQQQNQTAYDPFSPSPATIPNHFPIDTNERASPYFNDPLFDAQQDTALQPEKRHHRKHAHPAPAPFVNHKNQADFYYDSQERNPHQLNDTPGGYYYGGNDIIRPLDDHPAFHNHEKDSSKESKQHRQKHADQQPIPKNLIQSISPTSHEPRRVEDIPLANSTELKMMVLQNGHDFEYHTEKDELSIVMDIGDDCDQVTPVISKKKRNSQKIVDHIVEEPVTANEDQTVDSERALYGTPIRKKSHHEHRHRRGKNSTTTVSASVKKTDGLFIIHNVGIEDSVEEMKSVNQDPVHPNHYTGTHEKDENEEMPSPKYRRNRFNHENIAAHARRFISDHDKDLERSSYPIQSEGDIQKNESRPSLNPTSPKGSVGSQRRPSREGQTLPPSGLSFSNRRENKVEVFQHDHGDRYDDRKAYIPRRIGAAHSWEKDDDAAQQITCSESWDSQENFTIGREGEGGLRAIKVSTPPRRAKKHHKIWSHTEFDEETNETSRALENRVIDNHDFKGVCKSPDDEVGATVRESRGKDYETKAKEKLNYRDEQADQNALAEWDKAEAEWHHKTTPEEGPQKNSKVAKEKSTPKVLKGKSHPWRKGNENTKLQVASSPSREETITDFEERDEENHPKTIIPSPPIATDPADIFKKITKGLKEADNTMNRARRSADHDSIEDDAEEDVSDNGNDQKQRPFIAKRRTSEGKVAFAGEDSYTIHSYNASTVESNADDEFKRHNDDSDEDRSGPGSPNVRRSSRSQSKSPDEDEEDVFSDTQSMDSIKRNRKGRHHTLRSSESECDDEAAIGSNVKKKRKGRRSGDKRGSRHVRSFSGGTEDEFDLIESVSDGGETDTIGDSTIGDGGSLRSARSGYEHEQDLTILDHVDNAMTFVANSIGGLFLGGEKQEDMIQSQHKHSTYDDDKSTVTDRDDDTHGDTTTLFTGTTGYTGTTGVNTEDTESKGGDWLAYMEQVLFPANLEAKDNNDDNDSDNDHSVKRERGKQTIWSEDDDDFDGEDEDAYLLQQALAAARAVHHIAGVEFDEERDIDVMSDVKFIVVTIPLPLGLLFREHEIGVWVSKVIPGGNGAKNDVQQGDQLAAINGESSVHTSIDEVAAKISSTPSNTGVELTFLRYIGPLRPIHGAIIQEGFEVTDNSLNAKPKKRSNKIKKVALKPKSQKKDKQKLKTPPSSPGIPGDQTAPTAQKSTASSPKRTSPVNPLSIQYISPKRSPKSSSRKFIAPKSPSRSRPVTQTKKSPKRLQQHKLEEQARPIDENREDTTSPQRLKPSKPDEAVLEEETVSKGTKKKGLGKLLSFKKKK